jgi:Domain of unknown function (DUF397)
MNGYDRIASWRKSQRSNPNGACVEAAAFRKSGHSAGAGECVEAGRSGEAVAVRHSKDPDGRVIFYTRPEWEAFLAGVRDGEFDWETLAQLAGLPAVS